MDERERLRRLGRDPGHEDALDDPTTVDRIPEPGVEFDDPIVRSDGAILGVEDPEEPVTPGDGTGDVRSR